MAVLATMASCSDDMKVQPGYIGPSDPKIENGKMTPEVLLSFGRLSDPQLSPDGKTILYGVSYTSIEENRSVRNLFTIPSGGGEKVQLTFEGKSVSNARWSPDGSEIFFLQGGQLYKAPYKAGKMGKSVLLSDVPAGIDEFVLSPDGSQILYASGVHSAVERPVDTDPMLSKAHAYATEDLMYRHWDHWVETISHSFVAPLGNGPVSPDNSLDILGGPDVLFQLPNGPFGGIEQLAWSPDGRYIAYSCKKKSGKEYAFSTNTEIFLYCVLTGQTTTVKAGGGYDTEPVWSPDGQHLAFLSMARDGYEADQIRLMVADLVYEKEGEGQTANPTVSAIRTLDFPFNVEAPSWSADGSRLYFSALYDKAVQGIYETPSDLSSVRLLTADGDWHDYSSPFGILEDGTLLATWCSMDFPTEIVSVSAAGATQLTDENGHILSRLTGHKTEQRMVMGPFPSGIRSGQDLSRYRNLPRRPSGNAQPGMVLPLELPAHGFPGVCGRPAEPPWNDGFRSALVRRDFR